MIIYGFYNWFNIFVKYNSFYQPSKVYSVFRHYKIYRFYLFTLSFVYIYIYISVVLFQICELVYLRSFVNNSKTVQNLIERK